MNLVTKKFATWRVVVIQPKESRTYGKNNSSYGNLLKTGPITPFIILPMAVLSTGFNSFKISCQFSFKNILVPSLRALSPLNKLENCIQSLKVSTERSTNEISSLYLFKDQPSQLFIIIIFNMHNNCKLVDYFWFCAGFK